VGRRGRLGSSSANLLSGVRNSLGIGVISSLLIYQMGDKYYLHYLEVDDKLGLPAAMKISKRICEGRKKYWFHDEKAHVYRFRNIPRSYFKWETFKSHSIEPGVQGIIGKLNEQAREDTPTITGGDCNVDGL